MKKTPTIGGVKMKKLGKGKPGRMKNLVTRHLGKGAGEKLTKSDGARLMAKGKKTGNVALIRKGSFIKNMMREEKYEAAITDIDINTRHRNETIVKNGYGPANPDKPGDFWKKKADLWSIPEEEAKTMKCGNCAAFDQTSKTLKKIADAIGPDGDKVVSKGNLGYCELFEFKCAGTRTCDAWVHGGPITEGKGLYHNIHMKRKRGEKMRKAGAKGAPKPSDFERAKTTVRENDMKSFTEFVISEKKLTPAELKKREEVAQAIKRDNPKMPMDKKMAIATSVAKKTAEGMGERPLKARGQVVGAKEDTQIPDSDEKKLSKIVKNLKKSVKAHDKQQKVIQKVLDKDDANESMYKSPAHARLQKHMDKIRKTKSYQQQVTKLGGTPLKPGEQNPMKRTTNEEACCDDCNDHFDHVISEATYQGKTVKLNDPIRTNEVPTKKFKVYVKDGDKIKVVRFGDPNLSIKRDDPDRRKSFRARHNCDNPGPKTKPRYWSCFQWRSGSKVDN